MNIEQDENERFLNHRCRLIPAVQGIKPRSVLPQVISMPTRDDEGTSAFFAGRSVGSVSALDAQMHPVALWYFTPEALVYYLPPFLIGILDAHRDDTQLIGHLLAQVNVDQDGRILPRGQAILTLMSAEEKNVLLSVLHSFIDYWPNDITTLEAAIARS